MTLYIIMALDIGAVYYHCIRPVSVDFFFYSWFEKHEQH